jgi:hypothetical protein
VDPARLVVAGGSAGESSVYFRQRFQASIFLPPLCSIGGYLALLAGHPSLGITPSPQAILAVYPISNP